MKKVFRIMAIAVLGIAMATSCSKSEEDQIKDNAMGFLKAIDNMDFAGAKAYATAESADALDFMASMSGMAGEQEKGKGNFTIDEVKIDGEAAVVNYTRNEEGKDAEKSNLNMQKVDGKWLVKYTKEGMGGGDEAVETEETTEENAEATEGETEAAEETEAAA